MADRVGVMKDGSPGADRRPGRAVHPPGHRVRRRVRGDDEPDPGRAQQRRPGHRAGHGRRRPERLRRRAARRRGRAGPAGEPADRGHRRRQRHRHQPDLPRVGDPDRRPALRRRGRAGGRAELVRRPAAAGGVGPGQPRWLAGAGGRALVRLGAPRAEARRPGQALRPSTAGRPATESRITAALAPASSSRLARPVSTPATRPAPARRPGLDVARGVADDGELADGPAAQPEQGGQRHVRPRAATPGVGGRERQVDQRPPAELVDDGVPGGGGEAGGQAYPDARLAQAGHHLGRAGHRLNPARRDRLGVARLERRVGPLRVRLAGEDLPEHLDLGLPHGRPGGLHGLVVSGRPAATPPRSIAAAKAVITPPSSRRWCRPCPGRRS